MSNPLESLRRLINPAPSRGVVVDIVGDIARVATPKGLMEYPQEAGIAINDVVTIKDARIFRALTAGEVYWL